MNTPNKLTILRIFLVFPFLTLMTLFIFQGDKDPIEYSTLNYRLTYFLVAGAIFGIAMITDYVDGYLARKNKQITTFGKLFDPLADKFMTTSALIMLSIAGIVPIWITLPFILRDTLVDVIRNLAAKNNVDLSSSIWGKAKTMVVSIAIGFVFIIYPSYNFGVCKYGMQIGWELALLNLPLMIGLSLSVISGYLYFKQFKPYIKAK